MGFYSHILYHSLRNSSCSYRGSVRIPKPITFVRSIDDIEMEVVRENMRRIAGTLGRLQ